MTKEEMMIAAGINPAEMIAMQVKLHEITEQRNDDGDDDKNGE